MDNSTNHRTPLAARNLSRNMTQHWDYTLGQLMQYHDSAARTYSPKCMPALFRDSPLIDLRLEQLQLPPAITTQLTNQRF